MILNFFQKSSFNSALRLNCHYLRLSYITVHLSFTHLMMDIFHWLVSGSVHFVLVRLGCLYQNTIAWLVWTTDIYFSQLSRLGSLRSRCQHGWVLGEDPLPPLQTAIFSKYFHIVREREKALVSSFSYKNTNPVFRAWPSWLF